MARTQRLLVLVGEETLLSLLFLVLLEFGETPHEPEAGGGDEEERLLKKKQEAEWRFDDEIGRRARGRGYAKRQRERRVGGERPKALAEEVHAHAPRSVFFGCSRLGRDSEEVGGEDE